MLPRSSTLDQVAHRAFGTCLLVAVGLNCGKSKSENKANQRELPPISSTSDTTTTAVAPLAKVVVMVTIDWEGHRLPIEGLEAIHLFRQEWPTLPITHFICPAYFTSGDEQPDTATQIRSAMQDGDEVGVHFHGWFSLVQASGVTPRATPNFYATDAPLMVVPDTGDKGYEVPLSAYEPAEIARLASFSRSILIKQGFVVGTSFRVGGYAASQKTLEVLREQGFMSDSSAAWSQWFEESQGSFQQEVARYWPKLEELTQPYSIDTPSGSIIEIPNSGGFVEYVRSDEMLKHLGNAYAASSASGKTIYVGFGFHQDTADEYIDALSDALFNFRDANPKSLEFSTVTAVSQALFPSP